MLGENLKFVLMNTKRPASRLLFLDRIKVPNLFWVNEIDEAVPYKCGFEDHIWSWIPENLTFNSNVKQFLAKVRRTQTCFCLDNCGRSKSCACYKWNK